MIAAVASAAIVHQLMSGRARLARHHDRQGLRVKSGQERGEEIFVPAENERQDEGRDHARQRDRKDDAEERAPGRAAVHQRRLLHLRRDCVKLVAHHPDDDRQDHERVDEDESDAGVEQRQLLVENEKRQREDDRRQNELRDEEEREVLVAPRAELVIETAEPVGGERADDNREGGGADRADDAVDELLQEFIPHVRGRKDRVGGKPERLPSFPGRREIDPWDEVALDDVAPELHRCGECPVDREKRDERPEDEERVNDRFAAEARDPGRQ